MADNGFTNYKVLLTSEEYETEEFGYDTMEEAMDGFYRLVESCNKEFESDRIEREVNLVAATAYIGAPGVIGWKDQP